MADGWTACRLPPTEARAYTRPNIAVLEAPNRAAGVGAAAARACTRPNIAVLEALNRDACRRQGWGRLPPKEALMDEPADEDDRCGPGVNQVQARTRTTGADRGRHH